MNLHDIGLHSNRFAFFYPNVPRWTMERYNEDGAWHDGKLTEMIWNNGTPLGLWSSQDGGRQYVIFVQEYANDERSTFDVEVRRISEEPYSWYISTEHTLDQIGDPR